MLPRRDALGLRDGLREPPLAEGRGLAPPGTGRVLCRRPPGFRNPARIARLPELPTERACRAPHAST